jgi:transposase
MDTNPLFTLALGLTSPWRVSETIFDADQRRLDLRLAYADSTHFPCPSCGVADCSVYDADERRWRQLAFFRHQAFLTARVPRAQCNACGVKQVTVPLARHWEWGRAVDAGAGLGVGAQHAHACVRPSVERGRQAVVARGGTLRGSCGGTDGLKHGSSHWCG